MSADDIIQELLAVMRNTAIRIGYISKNDRLVGSGINIMLSEESEKLWTAIIKTKKEVEK